MFHFIRIRRACLASLAAGLWMSLTGFGVSAAERKHPVCETLLPWHKHAESATRSDSAVRLESDAPVVTPETEADKRVRQAELERVFSSSVQRQNDDAKKAEEKWRSQVRRSGTRSRPLPRQHRPKR